MDKTPASFDVFAVSPQGFEVHFQLNGEKVYQEAGKLLAAMDKDGFKAKATNAKGYGNGAHQANGAGAESDKICPAHNATLRRHQNDKGAWYSHKLAEMGRTATGRQPRLLAPRSARKPPIRGLSFWRMRAASQHLDKPVMSATMYSSTAAVGTGS